MAGLGAKRRSNKRRAQLKQTAKKARKRLEQLTIFIPKVSEDDLLSFQFAHFGDDSRPTEWFMPKDKAINYQYVEDFEDGLGYYADGVKRTLTDEQIAMFQRTELWQMKRDQMRQKEAEIDEADAVGDVEEDGRRSQSPMSEASSLEDELLAFASVTRREPEEQVQQPSSPSPKNHPKQTANSIESWKMRRRAQRDVPYDQRNKRNWEEYILDVDPEEGSLTHRRMARELDNQPDESVEMDY